MQSHCAGTARNRAVGRGRRERREGKSRGGRLNDVFDWAHGAVHHYGGPVWGPPAWTVTTALAGAAFVIIPLLLVVLYYQLVERWVIAWIQVRKGPNRVGWKGVLQPIADAIKLLLKEQMVPAGASKVLFFVAPIAAVAPAIAAWAVVPFMPGWVVSNVDAGILVLLAMTSLGIYGIII